jgi:hypothetical protein
MSDYYSKAAGCIAATAGTGCHDGLFSDRKPRGLGPIKVEAKWSPDLMPKSLPPPGTYWLSFQWIRYKDAVHDAPLNRRAWVAQERFLSSRIMHFSRDTLFWECLEHLADEASPDGLPFTNEYNVQLQEARFKLATLNLLEGISNIKVAGERGSTAKTSPHVNSKGFRVLWYRFRDTYSRCAITNDGDYLVALSGIAQYIGKAMNDQFVAGLWRNNLIESLCWRAPVPGNPTLPTCSFRPTVWRAPTWSWASLTLPLNTPQLDTTSGQRSDTHKAEVLDCFVDTKPSGQVVRASLTLRCRLIPIVVHSYNHTCGHGDLGFETYLDGFEGASSAISISLDDPMVSMAGSDSCSAWIVILRDAVESAGESCLEGLVIVRCANPVDKFERIGMFEHRAFHNHVVVDGTPKKWVYVELRKQHEEAEEQTIQLL